MSTHPIALDRALSALDVRLRGTTRQTLAGPRTLDLPEGAMMLGHVTGGEVIASVGRACALDAHTGSATIVSGPRTLTTGDAFLATANDDVSITAPHGAELMTAEVELSWPSTVRALPGFVFVTSFSEREPAAAALAGYLGADAAVCSQRGDAVICQMMVATVVMSLIRSWASADDAPHGWPAAAHDPFLDRVVSAVIDEPGHDWTVSALASAGAMSRTVLTERFQSSFGTSPASFVTRVRMECAKTMLEAGGSVSETSRTLGYTSGEGFSRAFRRHTGMVPSLWRAQRQHAISA